MSLAAARVGDRALEAGQHLVRRGRLELAAVEARALAGVAGGPGRLDEREHGVAVAVERSALTAWVLPDVAPLCHSSSRERLQRCSSPVARVRSSASRSCRRA